MKRRRLVDASETLKSVIVDAHALQLNREMNVSVAAAMNQVSMLEVGKTNELGQEDQDRAADLPSKSSSIVKDSVDNPHQNPQDSRAKAKVAAP